jgi:O-antigen ligase
MAEGAVAGTYASYDHYAGLLEMILPLAVAYGIAVLQRERTRHVSPAGPAIKACLLFGCATLILIGVIYSLSRMGFLCALAALFIVGSMALSLRGWRVDYEDPSRRVRTWLLSGTVGFTAVLAFVFLPTDPLVARFSDLAKTDQISADTRLQIWRDTRVLVKAYPLFGCGLGAYESCFLRFKTAAPMNTVDYAHNDYLQVLAELGIFGFAAGLLFVIHLVRRTIRGALYAHTIDERYLAIGCAAAMMAMLLHSLVDFNMYVPVNAMVFAWIAGVSGIFLQRRSTRSRHTN